jgi:type II secretory pathway pseudopilin PulG
MKFVSAGTSLPDVLVVLALAGLALAAAAPAFGRATSEARTSAGARQVALTLQAARWRAVATGTAHGLLFERDAVGWRWTLVRDGNGNGVRSAEVRDGIDPAVERPERLEQRVRGAILGFPPGGPFPRIPPASGVVHDDGDPVRFGAADLVSFGPLGTSSSGTFYVTDRHRALYAVVLYGTTVRVRVWRYDGGSRRWTR